MASCPVCRLLLEPAPIPGAAILACRSCGGAWAGAEDSGRFQGEEGAAAARLIRAQFAGVAASASFEGLPRFCPACPGVVLAPSPEGPGLACSRCAGLWLESRDLAALAAEKPLVPPPDSPPAPPPLPPVPEPPAAAPEPAPAEPPAATEEQDVLAELAAAGDTLCCPICLTVLPATESRCGRCDAALVGPDHRVSCPRCQGAVPFAAARCERCGWEMRTPEMLDQLYRQEPHYDWRTANAAWARAFKSGGLPRQPRRRLAVLTCMDSRIPVFQILGLRPGDAHVVRNAGGLATDDAIRSLLLSHHILGTRELLVINHTDCGLHNLTEQGIRGRIIARAGFDSPEPALFLAFGDLEENLRLQVRRVRAHPWLAQSLHVRGLVYDVDSGRLREVECPPAAAQEPDPEDVRPSRAESVLLDLAEQVAGRRGTELLRRFGVGRLPREGGE